MLLFCPNPIRSPGTCCLVCMCLSEPCILDELCVICECAILMYDPLSHKCVRTVLWIFKDSLPSYNPHGSNKILCLFRSSLISFSSTTVSAGHPPSSMVLRCPGEENTDATGRVTQLLLPVCSLLVDWDRVGLSVLS